MSTREERLVNLSIRAEAERRDLAAAIADVRTDIDEKRARYTSIGFWTGTLTAGVVGAYRLFGRNSFSSRVNRWSTAGSLLLAVTRFLFRLFR
ncbi:MAG TPA: hypothetical protein VIA45_09780 [Thermoanaerobaculia bacterium]|jgi:hypothetical protein